MGLDARKYVSEICEQHRRICTVPFDSNFGKYQTCSSPGEASLCLSVAEETSLKLALSETTKTGFLSMPI